jgi:hypothetical protein
LAQKLIPLDIVGKRTVSAVPPKNSLTRLPLRSLYFSQKPSLLVCTPFGSTLIEDSDDAFSLLGQVIQIAHGIIIVVKILMSGGNLSYEEIIEQDIFVPLNLSHSFFSVPSALSQYVVIPSDPTSAGLVGLDFSIFNAYELSRSKI